MEEYGTNYAGLEALIGILIVICVRPLAIHAWDRFLNWKSTYLTEE